MNCDSSIHLEVCSSCELIHKSPAFILLWGIQKVNRRIPALSSVLIGGSSNGALRVTTRESADRRLVGFPL